MSGELPVDPAVVRREGGGSEQQWASLNQMMRHPGGEAGKVMIAEDMVPVLGEKIGE